MKKQTAIGIIILAAGASVRMGKPKQTLEFDGKTLLQNAVQTALDSVCRPAAVVLGANAELLKDEIKDFDVEIAENPQWKSGMSGSIKVGLEKLLEKDDQINGVLITVCDQPFVSAELFDRIVETYRSADCLIVASKYAETLGVPTLFSRRLFPQLFDLENFGGAKKVIEHYEAETVAVSFEKGNFDIDTPEDYSKLINLQNQLKS